MESKIWMHIYRVPLLSGDFTTFLLDETLDLAVIDLLTSQHIFDNQSPIRSTTKQRSHP